jgi:hypothetical protein
VVCFVAVYAALDWLYHALDLSHCHFASMRHQKANIRYTPKMIAVLTIATPK